MGYMFSGCSSLISLNISNFNTSQVNYMGYMFYGCSSLISLNISNFDTSKVNDMDDMFYGCLSLEYINLNNFEVSKLKSFSNMFYKVPENVVICINESKIQNHFFSKFKVKIVIQLIVQKIGN